MLRRWWNESTTMRRNDVTTKDDSRVFYCRILLSGLGVNILMTDAQQECATNETNHYRHKR